MISPNHTSGGVCCLGSPSGLERELVHARDLFQEFFEFVDDLQDALHRFTRLEWVDFPYARVPRSDVFLNLRAVLHRACPLTDVDGEVRAHRLLREAHEMP